MAIPTVYNTSSATPFNPYSTATSTTSGIINPPKTIYNTPSMATQPYQTPQTTQSTGTIGAMGTTKGLIDTGNATATQATTMQHNAALMAQYGPGNYTIDASGNVLPKTQTGTTSGPTVAPEGGYTYNNQSYGAGTGPYASQFPVKQNQQQNQNQQQSNQQQNQQQQNQQQPYTPTYTGTQTTSPTVASVSSQLANLLNHPSPQVQTAAQAIVDLKNEWAQKGVNINQTAGFLTQATGEQALLNQQYLTALDAAQTNLQNVLTSQGQGINAAETAMGAVAPVPAQALGFYNPATGTYSQYGGGQGGGIASATQVLGNMNLGQNYYSQMVPNYTAAQNISNSFMNWLDTSQEQGGGKGVNFSQLNIGNELQNWVLGQNFSDPRFSELSQYLNELGNKISAVVGSVGGDTTNYKRQLVSAMLDPTASTDSIKQQIKNLLGLATTTMNSVYSSLSGQGGTSIGGTGGTAKTPTGEGTISAGGYTFTKNAQGQYVVSQ